MRYTHESFAVRRPVALGRVGSLIALAISTLAGCQVAPKPPTIVEVPAGSFVQEWKASIPELATDPATQFFVRGDTLYAYARSNQVYGFSATGGKLVFSDEVVPSTATLRAPTLLPDHKVIFPAGDTLEEYDGAGRRLQSLRLGKATHSSGVAVGYTFYVGLDSTTGGRLASLNLTPRVPTAEQIAASNKLNVSLESEIDRVTTNWEVLTIGAIQSTPVYYQGVVYAGAVDGNVWAINEQGAGIWSLPNGDHVFKTDGPIHADLKADDFGLYVASEDGSLYCVDRGSGRVKWTFYSGSPLDTAPFVTATTVYQFVPSTGLVAIEKHPLGVAREKWTNADAVAALAEDTKNVYGQDKNGYLIAMDKADGHVVFRGVRKDLTVVAGGGGKLPFIYAATPDGNVIEIGPVLRPGTMGELVMDTIPAPFQICLQ